MRYFGSPRIAISIWLCVNKGDILYICVIVCISVFTQARPIKTSVGKPKKIINNNFKVMSTDPNPEAARLVSTAADFGNFLLHLGLPANKNP